MLQIRGLLMLLIFAALPARALVFKGPGASAEDFQKFVLQKNMQTYTQWAYERAGQDEREAHPQVTEFSQRVLRGLSKISKQDLEDWNYLRNVIDLNRADREIFFLLAEKMNVEKEYCRYALLENTGRVLDCAAQAVPLPKAVTAQVGPREVLVIDGKAFKPGEIPRSLVPGNYQWRILSDQYQDRGTIGTAESFGQKKFRMENWVYGQCTDYKLNHEDFSVLTQAQIYFGEACVVPGLPPPRTLATWAAEHKPLLWTLGLIAGGLAVYQLRDKNLVITRP
jgi:hypothetical protein